MADVADRTPREWLILWHSLDDDSLLDAKFELYDRAEVVERDSQAWRFIEWALTAIPFIERLRSGARWPDMDASAFAEAFMTLCDASDELGADTDVEEIFRGALEVAKARGRLGE